MTSPASKDRPEAPESPESPEAQAPASSRVVPRSRWPSVLVVDPDRGARTPLAHLLSDRYSVWEAEDGLVAIKLAGMVPHLSLVISDVRLPTLDGVDLVRLFKSHPDFKHIPFAFLGAKVSQSEVLRLLSAGATKYFDKSQPPKKLVESIAKLIGD